MSRTPSDNGMPLHLQIRAARLKASLSIAELARLAGVNRSWLQKFDHDGKNITVDSLRRIISQLPQAQFVMHEGLLLNSSVAESAELDRLFRTFVRTSESLAERVRLAADALDAMAATADDLVALALEMDELWTKCRGGEETAPAPPAGGSEDAPVEAAKDLRATGSEEDDAFYGLEGPLPIQFRPVMIRRVVAFASPSHGTETGARPGTPEEN